MVKLWEIAQRWVGQGAHYDSWTRITTGYTDFWGRGEAFASEIRSISVPQLARMSGRSVTLCECLAPTM